MTAAFLLAVAAWWPLWIIAKRSGFNRHHCRYTTAITLPATHSRPTNLVDVTCQGCGTDIPCEVVELHHGRRTDNGQWEIVGIVDTTDFMAHRITHEGAK